MVRQKMPELENGLVNLAAIVGFLMTVIAIIPIVLLSTTPRSGGDSTKS